MTVLTVYLYLLGAFLSWFCESAGDLQAGRAPVFWKRFIRVWFYPVTIPYALAVILHEVFKPQSKDL